MAAMVQQEHWTQIDGYEQYQVSSHGRVWKETYTVSFYSDAWDKQVTKEFPAAFMSPTDQNQGYLQVGLDDGDGGQDQHLVHRLVMQHFGPEPPTENHTMVNHIDGDKQNNHVSNLQWVTPAENRLHESLQRVVNEQGEDTARDRVDEWL